MFNIKKIIYCPLVLDVFNSEIITLLNWKTVNACSRQTCMKTTEVENALISAHQDESFTESSLISDQNIMKWV